MSVRFLGLLAVCAVAVLTGMTLWKSLGAGSAGQPPEITYSKFLRDLQADQIQEVRIRGKIATGRFKDGKSFRVTLPYLDPQLADDIAEHTEATFEASDDSTGAQLLTNALPFLLLIGFWGLLMLGFRRGQKVQP